jgi:hypothetical protein
LTNPCYVRILNTGRPCRFKKEANIPNPVLFEDELRNILPFSQKDTNLQLKRILNSPDSEDFLTWSVFRPLMDVRPLSRWMVPFFRKGLKNWKVFEEKDLNEAVLKFWYGRRSKEYYPPKEHDEWLKNRLEHSEVLRFRERAKIRRRLEGPTEVDLVIETPKILTFIEAKCAADIDCKTSYDPYRDQITRNLDVGSYRAEKGGKRFFLIRWSFLSS